jgi:hypothetical protein
MLKFVKSAIVATVVACSVAMTSSIHAGQGTTPSFVCSSYSSTASCYGTLMGARTSGDASALASFGGGNGAPFFSAVSGGKGYSCTWTGTAPPEWAIMEAGPTDVYFWVLFNPSNGVCENFAVQSYSPYL